MGRGEPGVPAMSDGGEEVLAQLGALREENARLLERMTQAEERFRLVSRGVVRVQEAERGRISRELHDGAGQSLTALKLQLELLRQQAAAAGGPLAERLSDLCGLAEQTLHEVRHISHRLRPQMLDELGLRPTLRWLARSVEARTGLRVVVEEHGLPERLDPELETLAYRVVQEALTNASRHAQGATATVRLRLADGRLHVSVLDDGPGFDAAAVLASSDEDRGFGVRGMRDRVRLLGGRFALRSAPGAGTAVEVEVPVRETRP